MNVATPARVSPPAARLRPSIAYAMGVLVLIAIACLRLFPTYTTFTATYDEPFQIASGMQWLDKGTYTYEWQHPPLARVAVAAGPFLKGLRSQSLSVPTQEGNAILYSDGQYWTNLRLARLGTLPFLALGCIVIFLWARRWYDVTAGFWAVLLFVSLPPILGHAALATLDMACAATVAAALYQFVRWLENQSARRSVLLGLAVGLAFLTKFSSLPFFAVCCTGALAYFFVSRRGGLRSVTGVRRHLRNAAMAGCITFLVLWAGYRFSLAPLSSNHRLHASVDKHFGRSWIGNVGHTVLDLPLPLMYTVLGVKQVSDHNIMGHDSFLLGEYRDTGWWYFFPVVLGVKTPIGFLILVVAGYAVLLLRYRRFSWQQHLTALFAVAILLFCMTSRINLGVRHILPIYPLLAIIAGHAISLGLRKGRFLGAAAVVVACTAVVDSVATHPDYFAYVNQTAGNQPERILVDDLDWGQDLQRLSRRLHALGIKEVAIRYFGTAPLEHAGLPEFRPALPFDRTSGYVAVSVRFLTLEHARDGAYGWLKRYAPIERIGKSIYLYRIDQ